MQAQKSISARAWVELLALSAIWGASFLSIRIALDEVTFLWSVAHRVTWAALLLWVIIWLSGLRPRIGLRLMGLFLVMGVLNNVIPFSLMAWGQLHIESGLTSIFNASTAIFGVLVATAVFADERLTPNRGIGVFMGFAGVVTAVGVGSLLEFDLRSKAQLAVLAGALSYAFAGAWGRIFLAGLPPIVAAAGMLTASALVMIALAYGLEGPADLTLKPLTWAAIGYYSIIATAGAYLLYYRVMAMAGASNLMLCTLLIPPFAIGLGAWVRAETLEPRAFLGLGLLAVGLVILDGRILRMRNKT